MLKIEPQFETKFHQQLGTKEWMAKLVEELTTPPAWWRDRITGGWLDD